MRDRSKLVWTCGGRYANLLVLGVGVPVSSKGGR